MVKEIEYSQVSIRKEEDEILVLMEQSESLDQGLKVAQTKLNEDEQSVRVDQESSGRAEQPRHESAECLRGGTDWVWNPRSPTTSWIDTSAFARRVAELPLPGRVTKNVKSVTFACGLRSFRK